ncbi:Proteophosphoglycan 5, related [Eimeria praecox]|uniref:Proteophosphoglycan 5, related n=1 Tax=Eimeria praecox TaxID=51316 RepID=U6H1N7_9EIME|nr:Proteophosphoglycan 5, related [Eimeria praecox]
MDEIHAVLELFVSCRGSCWPLVRLEAEQQLLTQHLLMAAPMDREEIEDLIKKCFEADNNGEINFLSFWSGMENLLELLGIREPSAHVDDKVYGLQVFRDGLLAEAMSKHQGPTSSVLLSRDEVLRIIEQTNKSVTSRHDKHAECEGRSYPQGEACSSSLFWDEVYRETALLDSTSVLSITELSMMVFGFLKSYLRQDATAMRQSEGDPHDAGQSIKSEESDGTVRPDTSGVRGGVADADCVSAAPIVRASTVGAGATHEGANSQILHDASYPLDKASGSLEDNSSMVQVRWQKGWELGHSGEHPPRRTTSIDDVSGAAISPAGEHGRGSEAGAYGEASDSPAADASHILRNMDSEDPFSQLRHLLIFAGKVVDRGVVSKKDVQQLRHLNAAAVDCVDRIFVERDKRNEEVNDAVLSLRRMRTEKQQLIERLTSVEHQHSQLQLQQEQQLCERDKVDQLQAALASERLERERLQGLLRDKEEDLMSVTHEKDALVEKISLQNGELSRLMEVAHKEKAELSEEHRRRTEALIREKETLEERLRSSEDKARAAEAARQQLQGDAHLSASTLRQRILELEEDKQRQEAEAEENEALILQLQGRLEEKVQQVTILEVKNKQQARLLHQVRGVRNSLMQVLQDSKESGADKGVSTAAAAVTARDPEIAKLKAGMKAALAHIKDLEAFIDDMKKEQRRGVHPRYEISGASGDSSARSLQRKQTDETCSRLLRALPTLGDELEMSGVGVEKANSKAAEGAPCGVPDTPPRCEESGTTGERTEEGDRGAATEASMEASLSNQPSIREQFLAVEKQKAASSKAGGNECSVPSRLRQTRPGNPRDATSFASLRSEPSTVDATSKEPTSSASLPEAEDIFDPLDLLKSEDSMEAETQESSAAKDRLSSTSHPPQRIHLADRTRQSNSENGPYLVHLSSAATAVRSHVSELPPSRGSPKISSRHSASSAGSELPLEGRRCRSRAADTSASNEGQSGNIEACVALTSQASGSAFEGHDMSSRDKSALNESFSSTSSDGKFLMLTAISEAKKSPTASSSRRTEDRSQSSKAELAARALDPTTLSGMFSMLGACAAMPGNAPRREPATSEADKDIVRNTRSAGGEDSPKTKHKSSRLSAAATAAISAKDVSEFRSLRRVSQGSVHAEPSEAESADHIAIRRTAGSIEKAELTALKGEPISRESLLARRDQLPPPKGPSASPKAGHARARRTVSLGITGTTENFQGRDAGEQQNRLPSLTAAVSGEGAIEQHGGKDYHLKDSEVSQEACRAGGSRPKGLSTAGIEDKVASEPGSPSSSLRRRSGVLKSTLETLETCRSRGNANAQRTPRSRSSSSEPPSRKASSSHGTSTSHQMHEPKAQHETRNTEAPGQLQKSHAISNAYQETECESQLQTLGRQAPLVADPVSPQDTSEACEKVGLPTDSISDKQISNDELRSTQRLQHGLKGECAKLHDEQAASAAALLAAAAGVVDASLQQQQQMIQRQQEHHEDLQRAQQRRIDMLQEQLEHLQKAKEEQRESGEQEQKKLIHTLQAKLEELQKRQEQREQDFQEAQRKLQVDLEVQLKKKLEELRRSPRRTNIEATSSCYMGQNSLRASYAHRHDADIRTNDTLRTGYQHATSGGSNAFEDAVGEQALHPPAQQDSCRQRVPDVHLFATASEDFGGVNQKRVSQLLPSGKLEGDTLNCTPWHHGGTDSLGSVGRVDSHYAGAEARGQPMADAAGGYACEPHDRSSDSDGASSCASSSLMGSQCGLPVHGCSFEDVPTTTSSSFISQSATPAVCSSVHSHRGNYLASEAPVERQVYAAISDRQLPQSISAHRRESVLHRHNLLRPQPSEYASTTPAHVAVNAGQADPLFSPSPVQRISSSTGSLWSPKASRNHALAMGERGSCSSTSRPHADSANFGTRATASTTGSHAGSQEKLLRGELSYRCGSSRHPPDQEPGPRESGTGLGGPHLSAYHPVSRAERVISMQQAPIDSARFLGSSSIGEKPPSLAGMPRGQQGAFLPRDSQLPAPLASARSIASTSSLPFPVQSSSLSHTSRLIQQPMNPSQSSPPLTDFLGATSARSITSRRHTDSRNSQTDGTKRSRHSRCSESQVSPSPGRPRDECGARSTRSSGVCTRRESLLDGPRRTVNSLMSKLPRATASEINSARQRGKVYSCTAGTDTVGCGRRESISSERLEGSEAAAIMYRRASSSTALPDVELSRDPSHRRQKTHRGSIKKDKLDDKLPPDESRNAELPAAGESSSSASSSSGWAGFNGGFMSQVQKWIS